MLAGTQIGIYRGNSKNIQIFGRQNILWQRGPSGVGLDVQVSIEGGDNLREESSGSVSAILSKRLGGVGLRVCRADLGGQREQADRFHTDLLVTDDDNAFMVGLGARWRVRPTVYLLGEYVPRVSGFDLGAHHASFAIEKRVGGHSFQLNFSNSIGTTPAQIAQGANKDDWFIGFNIARKFY